MEYVKTMLLVFFGAAGLVWALILSLLYWPWLPLTLLAVFILGVWLNLRSRRSLARRPP